jgi:hypothetical protein
MAIAVVQEKTTPTFANDATATLGAPATNGNILIVIGLISTAAQTLSITADGGGGMSWASVVAMQNTTNTAVNAEIFWALVAGSPSVITAVSSGAGGTALHVIEVSGLHSSPVDGSASGESASGSAHNVSAGITTTAANTILVGGVVSNNLATYTLPGSFDRIDIVGDRSDAGWDIVSSTGTYDFATTSGASEITATVLAAFKEATANTSITPNQGAAVLSGNSFGLGFAINMPDEA